MGGGVSPLYPRPLVPTPMRGPVVCAPVRGAVVCTHLNNTLEAGNITPCDVCKAFCHEALQLMSVLWHTVNMKQRLHASTEYVQSQTGLIPGGWQLVDDPAHQHEEPGDSSDMICPLFFAQANQQSSLIKVFVCR